MRASTSRILGIAAALAVIAIVICAGALFRADDKSPTDDDSATPAQPAPLEVSPESPHSEEQETVSTADFDRMLAEEVQRLSRGFTITREDIRRANFEKKVAAETIEETVRNLMMEPESDDFIHGVQWQMAPDWYFRTIENEPRTKKLLKIAEEGTEVEKQRTIECIKKMYVVFLEELPDRGEEGTPWNPSVMGPGSARVYAYILPTIDRDATTLPLLIRVAKREKDAIRKYFDMEESPKRIASEHGVLLAYACDHFLSLYAGREDLRFPLGPAQIEVLDDFTKYTEARREREWNYDDDQNEIFDFATRFVEAGNGG